MRVKLGLNKKQFAYFQVAMTMFNELENVSGISFEKCRVHLDFKFTKVIVFLDLIVYSITSCKQYL